MSQTPLNQLSGMPQISAAFAGWANQITLTKQVQSVDSTGIVSTASIQVTFQGIIQPLNPKLIALKPEGQRAWQWLQIHTFSGPLDLDTNDQIIYNGEIFKVMATNDYSLNNYIEYHCCRDYQP